MKAAEAMSLGCSHLPKYSPYEKRKEMQGNLSNTQIKKGMVITVCFVVLRLIVAQLWNLWFGGTYRLSISFLTFLLSAFLVMSVGLVYLGFTRWVGVDLKAWWFKRGSILKDIVWGVGAIIGLGVLVLGLGIAMSAFGLAFSSPMASQDNVSLPQLPIDLVLGWFFGFAMASFGEETLFRGFLQGVVATKYGKWGSNLLQAAIFSVSHLGMEPLVSVGNVAFLLLFRFGFGILLGWLRMKRGSLLAAGIAHGIMG